MSWFSALKPDSLRDLLVHELKTTLDMEREQLDGLPRMARAATDPALRELFQQHLGETRLQAERLERVMRERSLSVEADTCAAARGAIADADVAVAMRGDDAVRDAALIAVAQSMEHLEIARYGTLRTWARVLGDDTVADELERSLDEEVDFDRRLTALAESAVNTSAAR